MNSLNLRINLKGQQKLNYTLNLENSSDLNELIAKIQTL